MIQQIKSDLKVALIEKDKIAANTLRSIMSMYTNEEKNNRLRKFYKITKAISILKTPESNEELYRKSALTY